MKVKESLPYSCPIEVTLDVIGGKWKGLILSLLVGDTKRFSELKRELPDITQRILTLQLRELEADGVINRTIYQEIPPRVEYSLTELGKTLKPVLLAMHLWGHQYTQDVVERKLGREAPPACKFDETYFDREIDVKADIQET
jgi:DNA-binding HxlR family transcriptional regulator